MQSIIRNVRDIDDPARQALERFLAQPLTENQRIIIQVVEVPEPACHTDAADEPLPSKLPAWCDVYAGLTDAEIAEVEAIALSRADRGDR